jgi:hypothetical protein
MNHFAVAQGLGLHASFANIVPQLRLWCNARFADTRMTQHADKAIPHVAQTGEEDDQGVCGFLP